MYNRPQYQEKVHLSTHPLAQDMQLQSLLPILASITSFAIADVQIISPAAGASVPVGAITITWQESNTPPLLANLAGYTAFLMCGGNNDAISVGGLRAQGGIRLWI